MVFDDAMIERMMQLLNNEYREDELAILVNRDLKLVDINGGWDRLAMLKLGADTLSFVINAGDSLNRYRDTLIQSEYQYFDAFLYLKMDTTKQFQLILDSMLQFRNENIVNSYMNQICFDLESIIVACGLISDERFINPLVNIINNPNKLDTFKAENLKSCAINALIQMNIEPDYSYYFNLLSYPLNEIQNKKFISDSEIGFFAESFHNQESFRELSKYLHSTAFTFATSEGYEGDASVSAFKYITRYIMNKELWEIIGDPSTFNLKEGRFQIYNWMQLNYGKYEIKRFW
jgi:hypothetical protein